MYVCMWVYVCLCMCMYRYACVCICMLRLRSRGGLFYMWIRAPINDRIKTPLGPERLPASSWCSSTLMSFYVCVLCMSMYYGICMYEYVCICMYVYVSVYPENIFLKSSIKFLKLWVLSSSFLLSLKKNIAANCSRPQASTCGVLFLIVKELLHWSVTKKKHVRWSVTKKNMCQHVLDILLIDNLTNKFITVENLVRSRIYVCAAWLPEGAQ